VRINYSFIVILQPNVNIKSELDHIIIWLRMSTDHILKDNMAENPTA